MEQNVHCKSGIIIRGTLKAEKCIYTKRNKKTYLVFFYFSDFFKFNQPRKFNIFVKTLIDLLFMKKGQLKFPLKVQ